MRFLPAALLLAICLMFATALLRKQESITAAVNITHIEKSLPAFTLADLDGGSAESSELKGPALINLFASWCMPCIIEYGILDDISRTHNVPVYGIAYKDNAIALQRHKRENALPYSRILMDNDGVAMLALGAKAVPETFVMDAKGTLVLHITGALTPDDVTSTIAPLLEKLKQ